MHRSENGRPWPRCGCGTIIDPAEAAPAVTGLTPRERQVLLLLGGAMANRLIARHLDVTERTVKKHVSALTEKLGLASRVEAALVAIARHGDLCAGAAAAAPAQAPSPAPGPSVHRLQGPLTDCAHSPS
ncbi:response regulator transcription factor [Streptomyces sp. NPDC004126]|uniref:response regulator transcription factor n=1 Tax=Streptomyces sp. NPDC004126 TaxID=3390695 RepID=UPI003D08BA66